MANEWIRPNSWHGNAQEMAEPNTILRGVVGSTVHGLSVKEHDDRDAIDGGSTHEDRTTADRVGQPTGREFECEDDDALECRGETYLDE